jgi:fructose-bisphosphate aldolase, class I
MSFHSRMSREKVNSTFMKADPDLRHLARCLVAPGKGILAADESLPTIANRLRSVGVQSTAEIRRDYRQMLFTTPGLNGFISGVILHDETIRQTSPQGERLIELIARQGMIPGIKVDEGITDLAGFPGEKVTEGLDALRGRLREYRGMGARFSKWRAVFEIGIGLPSDTCIRANAHGLARFASLSQEEGLVPIVEPEVLMDGDHSVQECQAVTELILRRVFGSLMDFRVSLEGMLLKPNMIVSGADSPLQADADEVARATLDCLRRTVPAAVPGIVFLSGGQSALVATRHLNRLNHLAAEAPWELGFSYGRALQEPALCEWAGEQVRSAAAQEILLHRARCNSLARFGRYTEALESEPVDSPFGSAFIGG